MTSLRAPLGGIDLKKALVLSVLLHALLLLVHFSKPKVDTAFSRPLEVILVNAQSQKTPNDAKVLAQVALDGGGQADKGRATTLPIGVGATWRRRNGVTNTWCTDTCTEEATNQCQQ